MKDIKQQTKEHNRLIYYLCLFNLIFVTFACQQKGSGDLLLSTADSLMSTRPDSALYLLENICISEIKAPAQKAKYALLLTQAQDKNYITPTTDSLIRIATEYYDSIDNDIAMQAKAHYYLGRVYQESGNNPATIREFLKAMPLMKQSKDYRLLCMLYGNLGYAYFQQDLLDDIYLSLSDAYNRSNQNDSAVYYAYKSLSSHSFYTKAGAYIILEDVARKKRRLCRSITFQR